ncbi:MAG: ABC transporter permease subunit, partial [Deltaproteobacteria bacterium]|nr:ABC transporter permease subunit [Deltaproteobacteria bacterium]
MSPATTKGGRTRRVRGAGRSIRAHGEPLLWLTGGGLATALLMILGLVALVVYQGVGTFWPSAVVRYQLRDGETVMGEVARQEWFRPAASVFDALGPDQREQALSAVAANDGWSLRRMLRTGNFELTGEHFRWISDFEIQSESLPEWALVFERRSWGRFYGEPAAFLVDGSAVADTPDQVWKKILETRDEVLARWKERRSLETDDTGAVNRGLEAARLLQHGAEVAHGLHSPEAASAGAAFAAVETTATAEFDRIRAQIKILDDRNARFQILARTATGREARLALADIVRVYPANRLGLGQKISVYLSRWAEFVRDDPREANSEGGVFPAIFGTVVMTLLMSLLVTPFGVLAALYLREYARGGLIVSTVRIAINNLAGVPSIVFGVFGLGFFCYIVGAGIDQLFYSSKLPTPTFGTGGILWASLTLALLTLPVVIVATEEALAAVPSSMREGSYACGASKWQTIRRIVL